MAIGIVRKQSSNIDEWLETAKIAAELRKRFENEMHTISCRELTGIDLTEVESRDILMNSDIPMKVCIPAVALAYRIVSELLEEYS